MKNIAKPATTRAKEARDYQSRVPFLLGAISNRMVAGGSRLYRSAFGIGLTEGRLMYVLGYESVLMAQRASEIMGIDKGATSRALAGLQRRGLVRLAVDDTDTRRRMIRFTRSGQALYDRLIATSLERERRLLSIFSEEEARTLAALLKRLHAHVSSPRTSKPAGRSSRFRKSEPARRSARKARSE
jgi:DNA-binding MarR family transcriptional regulator